MDRSQSRSSTQTVAVVVNDDTLNLFQANTSFDDDNGGNDEDAVELTTNAANIRIRYDDDERQSTQPFTYNKYVRLLKSVRFTCGAYFPQRKLQWSTNFLVISLPVFATIRQGKRWKRVRKPLIPIHTEEIFMCKCALKCACEHCTIYIADIWKEQQILLHKRVCLNAKRVCEKNHSVCAIALSWVRVFFFSSSVLQQLPTVELDRGPSAKEEKRDKRAGRVAYMKEE